MRIVIITIGSYGDVGPFVALGLGLQAAGHRVCLATHTSFEELVLSHGLDFSSITGDPSEVLESETGRAWLEAGHNPILYFHRLSRIIGPLLRQLLIDSLNACQDTDAIVLSHMTAGMVYPIIENMGIPVSVASLHPAVPTQSFPLPLFPPLPTWFPIGRGYYNRSTYWLAMRVLWRLTRSSVNRVRREKLNLPPLSSRWLIDLLRQQRIHFLYGYSPSLLPQPADWSKWNHITGYWFLKHPVNWQPPTDLVDFLSSGPPPVYVGFGSMTNRNPEEVTETVLKALARSRQRGVLLTGGGGLRSADLPDEVFKLDWIPHDWLFPQMTAVVHHGGAGTMAAGLRAGVPSIVVPFFEEQLFWGRRVFELGAGPKPIPRKQLSEEQLAKAIQTATSDEGIRACASNLGERIRSEDGITRAVEIFHRYIF